MTRFSLALAGLLDARGRRACHYVRPDACACAAPADPLVGLVRLLWQLSDESLDDGSAAIARMLGVPAPRSRANAGALGVCVTPSAEGGATMTTYVNDRAVLSESIRPDGREHAITEPDCRGQQRAEWSALGARVYALGRHHLRGAAGPQGVRPRHDDRRAPFGIRHPAGREQWRQEPAGAALSPRRGSRHTPRSSGRHAVATMPLGLRLSLADVKEASQKVAPTKRCRRRWSS